MKILCRLFGHKPPVYAERGWWSPGQEYGEVRPGPIDGVGRWHGFVYAKCARCGDDFMVCRIHIPEKKW